MILDDHAARYPCLFDPKMTPITFYGGPLSNFAGCDIVLPHPFTGEPVVWPTVEHRMQAMKATTREKCDYILRSKSAYQAKQRGRATQLREDWEDVKLDVVLEACRAKFVKEPFRMALLATGRSYVAEDSPTDDIWGWRGGEDGRSGTNLLGLVLMLVRAGLRPIYTGIGSRSTPAHICELMIRLAYQFQAQRMILRSGGAAGADQAFEMGAGRLKEIYRPEHASPLAYEIAEAHHPAWHRCGHYARSLHARNAHQILGPDLEHPILPTGVICWTPDGSLDGRGGNTGGTGQALRIAAAYGVPVHNLARPDHLALAESWLREAA